jgi:hypothetical protein
LYLKYNAIAKKSSITLLLQRRNKANSDVLYFVLFFRFLRYRIAYNPVTVPRQEACQLHLKTPQFSNINKVP